MNVTLGMISRLFGLSLLCLATVVFVSCSTPQTRSKERAESFSRLTKVEQRTVLEGRIKEGMIQDAVYIAMGNPSRRSRGRFEGKSTESWIYGRLESYNIPRYRREYIRGPHGELFSRHVYDPITEFRTVETFVVYFNNGRVIGWQEL